MRDHLHRCLHACILQVTAMVAALTLTFRLMSSLTASSTSCNAYMEHDTICFEFTFDLPQRHFSVSRSPLLVNSVAMQNLDEPHSKARLAHFVISCNNAVLHFPR